MNIGISIPTSSILSTRHVQNIFVQYNLNLYICNMIRYDMIYNLNIDDKIKQQLIDDFLLEISVGVSSDFILPTIKRASEILGTSETAVRLMLSSKNLLWGLNEYLDPKAIEYLSKKYTEKFEHYYYNCAIHINDLSVNEYRTFYSFCTHYSKHKGHVKSWEDIDVEKLKDDFYRLIHHETIVPEFFWDSEFNNLVEYSPVESITQSYLFNLKPRNTPWPKLNSEVSSITICFILSNRFHIFSAEADIENGIFPKCYKFQNNSSGKSISYVLAS